MGGMGKWIGYTNTSKYDPTSVISMTLVSNLINCPAFQRIPQARFSRSCLALAGGHAVVSQFVSSLNKEKEAGWMGERGGVKRRRQQNSPMLLYSWGDSWESVLKLLQGHRRRAFYEVWCASRSVGAISLNLQELKKRESKLWKLFFI